MSKCAFIYAAGTGFIFNDTNGLSLDLGGRLRWRDKILIGEPGDSGVINGINGRSALWDLGTPSADPFPTLLDPDVWTTQTINYPASFLGGVGFLGTGFSMGASINEGVTKTIKAIQNLPSDTFFALGGYSQGAAVMSSVYLAGLQDGTEGPLEDYRDRFLGGVCFGNPRRQRDFLGAHGVWSGSWDDPGSNSGGGGAFPATGSWKRLTGCDPDEWLEFTAPDDIFSSVGTTDLGVGFSAAIDAFLDLTRSDIIGTITGGLFDDALWGFAAAMGDPTMIPLDYDIDASLRGPGSVGSRKMYMVDGGDRCFSMPGGGHVTYPILPPCDSDGTWTSSTDEVEPGDGITYLKPKAGHDSCYQLALRWLESKAAAVATAPIILPSTPETTATAGWGTTLLTPT